MNSDETTSAARAVSQPQGHRRVFLALSLFSSRHIWAVVQEASFHSEFKNSARRGDGWEKTHTSAREVEAVEERVGVSGGLCDPTLPLLSGQESAIFF